MGEGTCRLWPRSATGEGGDGPVEPVLRIGAGTLRITVELLLRLPRLSGVEAAGVLFEPPLAGRRALSFDAALLERLDFTSSARGGAPCISCAEATCCLWPSSSPASIVGPSFFVSKDEAGLPSAALLTDSRERVATLTGDAGLSATSSLYSGEMLISRGEERVLARTPSSPGLASVTGSPFLSPSAA